MPLRSEIDLRAAINAISDVVQNRPRPLREFDQIYMKTGDMVLQSELVAHWADGKDLAFIGDGDSISVCVSYLQKRGIVSYGPRSITVYDFDERICGAITRFADKEQLELRAVLYNCLEPLPESPPHDCFYTNPPWGASNDGMSVQVFTQRGMEAVAHAGEGIIVIADDDELEWAKTVLANTQRFVLDQGFFVQRMMSKMHQYHLDDAPDLRSCNLIIKARPGNQAPDKARGLTPAERANFYGRSGNLRVRFVKERKRLDYGKAHDDEYYLELQEPEND